MGRGHSIPLSDDGTTALQTAILFPVVLLLVMTIVHAGLYYHANQRAAAAADRAVAISRWVGVSEEEGEAAGQEFLANAPLLEGNITVERNQASQRVVATVTGLADGPMPVEWNINVTAQAPLEQFIPEPERGQTPSP